MRWIELHEMPIGNIYTHGDFSKPGSLRQDDLSLTTQKRQDKIKRVLQKAPVLIDLHFVNLAEMIDVGEHIKNSFPPKLGFKTKQELKQQWGIDIKIVPNAVNLIYVQNEGTDRVPLTPWIIAHRLGHAFAYPMETKFTLRDILDYFTDAIKKISYIYADNDSGPDNPTLAKIFGTTRACREGLIKTGRTAEWLYDCFAQLCVIGDIKFNKAPESIMDANNHPFTADAVQQHHTNIVFKDLREFLIGGFHEMLKEVIGQALIF